MSLVAVLLPVRIETAFDVHAGGCRLRVIVLPDVPWIDRHDPTPSRSELEGLDDALNEAGGDFSSVAGRKAFARFAQAYGGARAAWLARTFPAIVVDGRFAADRAGVEPREEGPPRGNVIRGLPRTIELWVARIDPPGGVPPRVRIAELHPTGKPLRVEIGEAPAPADPEAEFLEFSWQGALDAGLAADVELADFGVDPFAIDVLYAIGLGDDDPAALFAAHRDAGLLAILAPGQPTNTVAGQPAADLGRDAAAWLETVRGPYSGGEEGLLSTLLVGASDAVGPLPAPARSSGDDPLPVKPQAVLDHQERAQLLVRALWPALWGASLKDIWGIDAADVDAVGRLGDWAADALLPEGPLPPIRIGAQPYGLLPVTSLANWDCAGDAFNVEKALVEQLRPARTLWARRARGVGTIVDADTDRVLSLLERLPVTLHLMSTLQVPLEFVQVSMAATMSPAEVRDWWRDEAARPRAMRGGDPLRAFVQLLAQTDITLPLVEPTKPQEEEPWLAGDGRSFFAIALHWFVRTFAGGLDRSILEYMQRGQPRSLLYRLLVHSAIVAASEVVRTGKGLLGPVDALEGRLSQRFDAGARPGQLGGTLAGHAFAALWKALDVLAEEDPRVLERTLCATLDTASHRIDPWITGLAWRRLASAPYRDARRALAAYGWVDRPLRGTRGPTAAGLLLAPSVTQARAAIILRDKAVYDPAPAAGALPGTRRWDMSLDSARVRLASQLAAEVRIGAHLSEALGRQVERILETKDAIDVVRRHYMLHSANQGRRVCDGEQVITRTPAQFQIETGIALRADQQQALQALREAVDAYGDLLVADAVFDVLSGRGDTAGAAMEAAAGLDLPPELDVIRTPRPGATVSTMLAGVLPASPLPAPDADASPLLVAEPDFAAYVIDTFPNAASWQWTREDKKRLPDGTYDIVPTLVRLDQLGLEPIDLVALRPEQIAALVLEFTATANAVQPRVAATGSGPRLHARLQRIAMAFAGRPAAPSELSVDAHRVDHADDDDVRDQLWSRYLAVHARATALRDALKNLLPAVIDAADGDAELRRARRWAIAPAPAGDTDDPLARRKDALRRALDAIDGRLRDAPPPVPATTRALDRIASALVALVAPGASLPIFARMPRSKVATTGAGPAALTPEPREAMPMPGRSGAARNRLDRTWLSTIAAVRPCAARVEAYELEALLNGWAPLRAWTNWAGNPWQQGIVRGNGISAAKPPALFVAYGPEGALDDNVDVAVAILDAWTETIPSSEQTVTAAFGFNAPASRPPQAILLAVPPVDGAQLDNATLLDIVSETRELAHARMATPRDLADLAAALPMTTVPSHYSDPAGVELAGWERMLP